MFSGSLDHRINLLDPKKVSNLLDADAERLKEALPKSGIDLVNELKTRVEDLEQR